MKTPVKLLFFLVCIGILAGCQKDEEIYSEDAFDKSAKMNKHRAHGLDQYRCVFMKDYNNLKVNYRIIGKGPVDMVFIPGWSNSLEVYTHQFDYFRDKARCIYIDLPGHGQSDAPTPNNPLDPDSEGLAYTQELMIDAIKTVVKKEGLKKFIGVGFSWSGNVLKLFETKYPGMIKQLILLDIAIPVWVSEDYHEGAWYYYTRPLTPEEREENLKKLIPPETAPPGLWEFGLQCQEHSPIIMANAIYHWLAEENCQPYSWEIPILVIYNVMDDARENLTRLHYPGCEIVVLEGDWHVEPYQHVIQWAYQDVVNQLMDDFMEDRPGKKY